MTVAVPVRNGARTLREALESVVGQTHQDLHIVVCDNASDDETPAICREFADRDPRVTWIRHDRPVTVNENWRSGFEQARLSGTPYFMWAADDDLRDEGYVAALLEALEGDPAAGLAFGGVVKFLDGQPPGSGRPHDYRCATRGISISRRLFMYKNGPFAPYGLFRTSTLASYRWYDHTVSPDFPLFMYVLVLTEIVQVTGPTFYYREPVRSPDHRQRALRQSMSEPETFLTVRLSWRCALASRDAAVERGSRRIVLYDFLVVFAGILWGNRRQLVGSIVQDWRFRRAARISGRV